MILVQAARAFEFGHQGGSDPRHFAAACGDQDAAESDTCRGSLICHLIDEINDCVKLFSYFIYLTLLYFTLLYGRGRK